jgi:predicted PurR-regulated permease PerM
VATSREPIEPEPAPDEGRSGSRIAAGQGRIPPPAPVVIPRWIQLVVLPLGIVGLWALARAAHTVLLIVIVAVLIALILNPLVKRLAKRRVPRGLSILVVYLGLLAATVGIGVLLSDPVSTQISHLAKNIPSLIRKANHDLANFQHFLNKHGIKIQVQKQGQTALQTLQKSLLKHSGAIVSFSQNLLRSIVQVAFDAVLVLVLSIYLLVYGRQIGELVKRIMPEGDGTPEDDFPLLVQRAVSGYVRGQLTFSVIMGTSAGIALTLFGLLGIFPDGERYAVFFGGFYGLMEFVPYIGPIIGPAPAVAVALFQHPISAVWVVLLFIALQQLEGHFVAPQVFRISLRINPILIIIGLLLGFQLYGIAGALIALPVLAVLRETVLYLRRHTVLEPWQVTVPGSKSVGLDPDRCPDCGAPHAADDAYCRSCGASLEPRVSAER